MPVVNRSGTSNAVRVPAKYSSSSVVACLTAFGIGPGEPPADASPVFGRNRCAIDSSSPTMTSGPNGLS